MWGVQFEKLSEKVDRAIRSLHLHHFGKRVLIMASMINYTRVHKNVPKRVP